MQKNRCPACGAARYHGGRCRECFYAPFTEAVAHGTHYHAGEALVLTTPPKATQPNRGCDSYSGKRLPRIPKFVWILLAVVLCSVFPGGIVLALIFWGVYSAAKRARQ